MARCEPLLVVPPGGALGALEARLRGVESCMVASMMAAVVVESPPALPNNLSLFLGVESLESERREVVQLMAGQLLLLSV